MQNYIVFIGILSLLQMAFIPGYLVWRAFKLESGVFRVIIFSFAFSLIINYIVVAFLTTWHIYTPKVVWTLLSLEYLALAYCLWPSRCGWESFSRQTQEIRAFWQTIASSAWLQGLGFLAVFALVFFIFKIFIDFGQIFQQWDPVVSYNLWAGQWAQNAFPVDTWHYPQGITTNWSLSYVMMQPFTQGVNLQFFAKALMTFFEPVLLLIFLDLAISYREWRYLLALVLLAGLLRTVLGDYLGQGWMDVPVTALSMMVPYALFLAAQLIKGDPEKSVRYLIVAGLIAGGAASIKQAGLYMVLCYPLLAYVLVMRYSSWNLTKRLKLIFAGWVLSLAICLPWYGTVQWLIDHGRAYSEVGYVTHGIYHEMDESGLWRSVLGLFYAGVCYWLLFVLAGYSTLRVRSPWRLLSLLGIIYGLIWLKFYDYDQRNLTLSLPLIAGGAAFGIPVLIKDFWQAFGRKIQIARRGLKPGSALALALLFILLCTDSKFYGLPRLKAQQTRQEVQLGDSTLNWELLQYVKQRGFSGKIVTSWDYLSHVPGLAEYYQPYRPPGVEANIYQSAWMSDPTELRQVLERYPVRYILSVSNWDLASPEFMQYLQQLVDAGKLKIVISLPDFTVYEIVAPVQTFPAPKYPGAVAQ